MSSIINTIRLTIGPFLILFGLLYKCINKLYGNKLYKKINSKLIITIGVLISFINIRIGIVISLISIFLQILENLILEYYLNKKAKKILGEYGLSINKIKTGRYGYVILNNKKIRVFAKNHDIESGSTVIVSKMMGVRPVVEDIKYSNIINYSKLKKVTFDKCHKSE